MIWDDRTFVSSLFTLFHIYMYIEPIEAVAHDRAAICFQLQKENVNVMLSILKAADSSYFGVFQNLYKDVMDGTRRHRLTSRTPLLSCTLKHSD